MIEIHTILKSFTGIHDGFQNEDIIISGGTWFPITGVKHQTGKSNSCFSYGLPVIPFG